MRLFWATQNALTTLAMIVSFSSKSVQDKVTQDLERTDK